MKRWLGIALLVLFTPAVSSAQDEPERLLPAGTQFYLRWDGIEAHRAAYEKTALGKMLQGDTGKFITGVFAQLQDSLGALLTVEQLLQGVPPERLQQLQADAGEAPKLLSLVGKRGFILAGQFSTLLPPQAQVTLILPNAGTEPGPLFGAIRLVAALAKADVKQSALRGRTVHEIDAGEVHIAWWVDGKHAVLTVGTAKTPALVKNLAADQGPRLVDAPLFKKLIAFRQFPTAARGFLDVTALLKVVQIGNKDIDTLIADLGINGIQNVALYSGFDGDAERGLIQIQTQGPPEGIRKVFAGKAFTLADVPPLPDDVLSWTMTNLDLIALYDGGLRVVESITRLASPQEVEQAKALAKQADDILGVKLRDDVLAALGGRAAFYTSPAEGPLAFGQTYLLQVKDPVKLQEALDLAIKGGAKASGADVSVKKRTYHGVELREIHAKEEGFFLVPTYAIHKNWLVIGFYPQVVEGFVLRANGELPVWKPGPKVAESLGKLPREFVALSYTDPQPSVKQILSLAPIAAGAFNSFSKDAKIDVGSLPNAHEATRHLFPNVSVTSVQGDVVRIDSRSSLELPLDFTGLDAYSLFFVGAFAFRGF